VTDSLKPLEILSLWNLASLGGSAWNPDFKPILSSPSRNKLASLKLIDVGKLKRERPGKKPSLALRLSLTETGWNYLQTTPGAELHCASPQGAVILGRLMASLTKFLANQPFGLATIFLAQPRTEPPTTESTREVSPPVQPKPPKISPPKPDGFAKTPFFKKQEFPGTKFFLGF
jgi:hypothetical protein